IVTRPWACAPIAAAARTANPTAPAKNPAETALMRFLLKLFWTAPAAATEDILPRARKGQPSFAMTYGLARGISMPSFFDIRCVIGGKHSRRRPSHENWPVLSDPGSQTVDPGQ